ncbi:replicative DNA helicase [Candidatus Dependentiae bacterium]|nr:MAG: replicative DNA helicase [Candidatus Dependentiae bacterium]
MENITSQNQSYDPQLDNALNNEMVQAEKFALVAIMTSNESYELAAQTISPEDFMVSEHKAIFQKLGQICDRGIEFDIMVLYNEFNGVSYFDIFKEILFGAQSSMGFNYHTVNTQYYVDQVKNNAQRRKLITLGQELIIKNVQPNTKIDEVVDTITAAVSGIFTTKEKEIKQSKEISDEVIDQIKKMRENPSGVTGIPTGFTSIDYHLSGLHKTDLIILAARPARGKSSFALQIAKNVALYSKTPVMFFSLEMGADQLMQRIIASESRVPLNQMRSGQISDIEMEAILTAKEVISNIPIYFNDKGSVTVKDIRRHLKAHNNSSIGKDNPIGLVVIDYLQLMAMGNRDNMVQAVAEISRGLKLLAKDFNVPVIALSQLSRGVESRGGEPKLSDLRDSGAIEQDADIVCFLHSETSEEDGFGNKHIVFLVEKHRNGATFKQNLEFSGSRMLFREVKDFNEF